MPGNVQDGFLAEVRRSGVTIVLSLANGTVHEGVVTAFDSFTIVLRESALHRLIYKHAIATIAPKNAADFTPAQDPP